RGQAVGAVAGEAAQFDGVAELKVIIFADVRLDADGGAVLRLPAQAGAGLRGGGVENFRERLLRDALKLSLAIVVDEDLRRGDQARFGIVGEGIDDDVGDARAQQGGRSATGGNGSELAGLGIHRADTKGAEGEQLAAAEAAELTDVNAKRS